MKHLATALIAAAVAIAVVLGANHLMAPATHKTTSWTWEELSQQEIDLLTAELKKLPKRDVAIFCMHGCDDLALDFDNAFESAHWNSGIERPAVDTNTGINVGCTFKDGKCPDGDDARALQAAIIGATGGRLQPGLIDAKLAENRLALVISRKR